MAFINVVFPHPEGPITAFNPLGKKRAVAWSNIKGPLGPACTVRFLQLSIGM
jgi:hypothetical protein